MGRPSWLRVPNRVAEHPRIAPLEATSMRSRVVRGSRRFWLREVLQRPSAAGYALREQPAVRVYVGHGTHDAETFDQVFLQDSVAPPAAVLGRIAALGRPPRILDLGANVGYAAAWFAARFEGAEITCVEPDPRNLSLLERAAKAGGWRVVAAAAAASPGTLRFDADGSSMARARPDGGIEVPAIDTFALAEELRPDLVKIDIEGGEWVLLADPRLERLAGVAIGLEFHTHLAPGSDTRGAAVSALESAGYQIIEVPHVVGAPPGEGSLWALRPGS